jgi:hypothetical protein
MGAWFVSYIRQRHCMRRIKFESLLLSSDTESKLLSCVTYALTPQGYVFSRWRSASFPRCAAREFGAVHVFY